MKKRLNPFGVRLSLSRRVRRRKLKCQNMRLKSLFQLHRKLIELVLEGADGVMWSNVV